MNVLTTAPNAPPTPDAGALPHPAPGFAGLVYLHLASLVREYPVAWILFGVVILWLPVASILVPSPDPTRLVEGHPAGVELAFLLSLGVLNATASMFAVLVALFWPDAVWRKLPPGGREAIDALPPGRRLHRTARCVAGAGLPMAMFASIAATGLVLRYRATRAIPEMPEVAAQLPSLELVSGPVGLLAAYALGSILALRFGRILFPLLVGVAATWAVVFTSHLLGWATIRDLVQEWVVFGAWSPTQAFFALTPASGAHPLGVVLWFVGLAALMVYTAGRYDRG